MRQKDFFRDKSKNELFWGLISGPYFFNQLAAPCAYALDLQAL